MFCIKQFWRGVYGFIWSKKACSLSYGKLFKTLGAMLSSHT